MLGIIQNVYFLENITIFSDSVAGIQATAYLKKIYVNVFKVF